MAQTILVILLAMIAVDEVASGIPCRFESLSTSRRTCIFPCRCTKGCDQLTGQCLNGGQCENDHPTGYKWDGTACQIGNVAINKTASQVASKWGDMYPASKAIDGCIDPLSYQQCAIPNAVSDIWWKVDLGETYKLSRVIIYTSNTLFATDCPAIEKRARDRCGAAGINQLQCQAEAEGCCWDEEARGSDIACYKNQCKAGYFGWRCRFQCYKCPTCDRFTGKCSTPCQDGRWGVGCLLESRCYYDDQKGVQYMGTTTVGYTNHNGDRTCKLWTHQSRKPDSAFPDGSRAAAGRYCRNPDNSDKPWCYYNNVYNWVYCRVNRCLCDSHRFGINCENECHCKDENDNCQSNSSQGRCNSGCAPHFTGQTCQECANGYFGMFCNGTCHCSSGIGDKTTGHCPSGCSAGWTGDNCQTAVRRLSVFTLSVGNSSDVNGHTQCASHNGVVAAGATVNESCTATGRYLSFRQNGGGENHVTTLCEVVVIGYEYISCLDCPHASTCNDVVGCDACATGKQQPDCLKNCTGKTYGVNCNEICGHCKEQEKCAITSGRCPNGCETWYTSDVCKTLIASPRFQSSIKPDVTNVTNSSARISWPKAANVSSGLEDHYYYVLWLHVAGESEKNITRVEQGAGENQEKTRIIGLTYNTNYSLRVEPYREHNEARQGGASTGVVTFKTKCTAPSPPIMDSVEKMNPRPPAKASVVVKWQAITESGCDVVTSIRMEYKQTTVDSWKYVEAVLVNQTNVTISNLTAELYEVRLVVTNNENISSTSNNTYVDFRTIPAIPGFQASIKPKFRNITSSAVRVSWPKATNVSVRLEDHYHYVLWLQVDGGRKKNVTRVEQGVGEQRMKTWITGLTFNTKYSLRVEPYREHNGEQKAGASTEVVTFKTKCIAPSSSSLELVEKICFGSPKSATIVVNWKAITESGCDDVKVVRVKYKGDTSDSWSDVDVKPVTRVKVTIANLSYERYEVRLVVFNNENISSVSPSKYINITRDCSMEVNRESQENSNVGVIAGSTAGVIVLLAVFSGVVFVIFIRRRRQETDKTQDSSLENMEGAGLQNGKLEDENEINGADADVAVQDTSELYANTRQVTQGIKVTDLAAYVEDKKHHNSFQKDFNELPSGVRAKCEAASKPGNKTKNRFLNIIAYDHTRVVLSTDSGLSDYINANYIKGYTDTPNAYIATQGPKEWTIEDMWRMVWQEKTNTIVMLANLVELGKEKCNKYWPEKGQPKAWGNSIVESSSEEHFADYVIREFSLKNQGLKKMRKIRQFHFTAWPDKGTPDYSYPLLAFHRKLRSFDSERRGPLLVHCSAGVGRTGTFIAIDILTQQAAAEGTVDVLQCVDMLRSQRMDMVQTLDQYVYVFQALVDSSEVTVIPCSQLKQSFNELCEGDKLDKQFKRLSALKTLAKNNRFAALEPNNVDKNRFIEIIPDDLHRPYLCTPWKDGTNYINAVTVHGYKQRNAYILTQSPMPTTVIDLWRLLYDHESRTIVMLDDIDDSGGYAVYWPNMKESKCQYGPFLVELTETNLGENKNVTTRDFKMTKTSKPDDNGVVVRQFHLKRNTWNKTASVPGDKIVLLDMLDLVEKWQQQSGNGPIAMHCSDGASRCGLVCAASYILEHLKIEQEVNVFNAVQHIRTTRLQLVTDLEQYRFLYEVALAYMSQFDTYANFQ